MVYRHSTPRVQLFANAGNGMDGRRIMRYGVTSSATAATFETVVLLHSSHVSCNAVITIAIRLRYDYDPTTTHRARLLPFDASKK